jgi:hypothetical protein
MLERVSARSNKYGMFFPSNLKANLIPMPSHVVMEPRNNPFRLYYVLRWLFCTLLPGRILEILTQLYRYPLVLDHEEVLDGYHHELPLPNRRHSSTLAPDLTTRQDFNGITNARVYRSGSGLDAASLTGWDDTQTMPERQNTPIVNESKSLGASLTPSGMFPMTH